MIYIYGLIDPITKELRYIGQAVDFEQRYRSHLHNARTAKITIHRNAWIKGLLNKNTSPEIIIIDKVDDANYWEVFYIAYFKMIGCNLTNIAIGGNSCSGTKWTEERRIKTIKSRTGLIRLGCRGKPLSDEHKLKLSIAFKGRTYSKETIKKYSICKRSKKEVLQFSLNGEFIKEWENGYTASRELKINSNAICNALHNRSLSSGGFKWKYK